MTFPVSDITRRFASGRTYRQYLEHMQHNRELLSSLTQEIRLSADDAKFFGALADPIKALVISEDWCPDCALNVPVLMQVAGAAPQLEVRFLGRDDNLDLLEYAKKAGRKVIPTFLFFDAAWDLIGHWTERPLSVDARLAEWDALRPAPSEPDRTQEVWRAFRRERSAFLSEQFRRHGAWRETVAELRRILSREVSSNQLEIAGQV